MWRGGTLYAWGNPSTTAVPLGRRRSPLPYVPSERMTREASQPCASTDIFCEFRMSGSLGYAQSVYQRRKPARPPCETFLRNVGGMAGMPPSGGSPDWGIPCVSPNPLLAESVSVAEHARDSLRRSPYPARGNEFFLYEKMSRGAIDHEGSTSEVGGRAQAPVPTPPPQKEGIPLGGARGRASRSSTQRL